MQVAKLNDNGEEIGAMEIATVEDTADLVGKALRKAWFLGQTYWQQADSESWSQNKKSAGTQEKFQQLVDETLAAILETPTSDLAKAAYKRAAPHETRTENRT